MNTRELLELAALATGRTKEAGWRFHEEEFSSSMIWTGPDDQEVFWCPGDDDGDCARMEARKV